MRATALRATDCHLNQINKIDVINERFDAVIYLELWCKNGAKDADLNKPTSEWPVDASGTPTLRPSIVWFAKKLDFNNVVTASMMSDPIVKTDGDDVGVGVRCQQGDRSM